MTTRAAVTTLLLLLFLTASMHSFSSSSDLIETICQTTPLYELCVASLRPLSPANATSIAAAMVNVVLGNMTETLGFIESQIRRSRDPAEERALAECAELYRPVVKFNIPQAMDAMRRGELGFASYVLGDAQKQADSCQKGISGAGGGDGSSSAAAAVVARNKLLKNLLDVAIAVIKSLMKGG